LFDGTCAKHAKLCACLVDCICVPCPKWRTLICQAVVARNWTATACCIGPLNSWVATLSQASDTTACVARHIAFLLCRIFAFALALNKQVRHPSFTAAAVAGAAAVVAPPAAAVVGVGDFSPMQQPCLPCGRVLQLLLRQQAILPQLPSLPSTC
jgi:hypothetical protein